MKLAAPELLFVLPATTLLSLIQELQIRPFQPGGEERLIVPRSRGNPALEVLPQFLVARGAPARVEAPHELAELPREPALEGTKAFVQAVVELPEDRPYPLGTERRASRFTFLLSARTPPG